MTNSILFDQYENKGKITSHTPAHQDIREPLIQSYSPNIDAYDYYIGLKPSWSDAHGLHWRFFGMNRDVWNPLAVSALEALVVTYDPRDGTMVGYPLDDNNEIVKPSDPTHWYIVEVRVRYIPASAGQSGRYSDTILWRRHKGDGPLFYVTSYDWPN